MRIECLPVGALEANCYLVAAEGGASCIVIDPGGEADRILSQCAGMGVAPALILLTHGHVDHIAGAAQLKQRTGARLLVHEADREFVEHPHPYFAQMVGGVQPPVTDGALADGQEIEVDGVTLTVLHTPGHSPGSICLLGGAGAGVAFTGDTLFAGSVGRTDLPGGSWQVLAASLQRLVESTTPETVVYPGHGPASTIAEELTQNPYLSGNQP